MVGIVLVSHSRALAQSVQQLVRAMSGPALPLAIAAGVGDDHAELGTDAVEISEAIAAVHGPEGVVVLMDMGSAILSAETALDLLDGPLRANVRFCAAPFVEGAVAAGVTAHLGAPLDEVHAEAVAALKQKQAALGSPGPSTEAGPPPEKNRNTFSSPVPGEHVRLTVRNEHGLHARPAARLILAARPFQSEITVRNLSNQRGPVSVKSLSSLATLEILRDHEIEITARGDDAVVALKKISALVESGLGDALPSAKNGALSRGQAVATTAPQRKTASAPRPISGGIAFGPAFYFRAERVDISREKARDPGAEIERLKRAVATAQHALESRRDQMSTTVGTANAEIYEAQILALHDPELIEVAIGLIRTEQAHAALAWDCASRRLMSRYESLEDPYLRERAADLEDVGRQVLELLADKKSAGPALGEPGILIAASLTPNQVSNLDPKRVRGVILLDGGPTAHASILLKALGIPALIQARSLFADTDLHRLGTIAFDGSTGEIWLRPEANFLAKLHDRQAGERQREEEARASSCLPATTLDGHPIDVFANIGDASEVEPAFRSGADGVGLFRTEFLFLDRDSAPTEEEQRRALLAVAEKMGGRPLIVRTLDAGGDKALAYLQMAPEENPFLGVRALRLCLSREELFTTQLRAILRAGHGHDVRIMFPMVAHVTDLDRALEFLAKVHRDLEKEDAPHLWPVKTGIMIEIPSAALQAEELARRADFFSIGTNDLTQYTLAADRGNPELALYQDALHPAVLRLIEMVVKGARAHDRLVAVCGEAASDEKAAAVFVGLGVRELSLTSAKIPCLKASFRRRTLSCLQQLGQAALRCRTAGEVRSLMPAD